MARGADAVRTPPPSAGRADIARDCKSYRVPIGLPPHGPCQNGRLRLHALCGRPRVLGRRGVERFAAHAAAIVWEEGFHVNHHKTRIMRQGVRQHLAGVVVNAKVQVARDDLKLLEAILTNCVRFGPESQNRERVADFRAHLQGRVGFVEMVNRTQGQGLRALLGNIQWDR
jgi:hypothetical protein